MQDILPLCHFYKNGIGFPLRCCCCCLFPFPGRLLCPASAHREVVKAGLFGSQDSRLLLLFLPPCACLQIIGSQVLLCKESPGELIKNVDLRNFSPWCRWGQRKCTGNQDSQWTTALPYLWGALVRTRSH